MLPKTLYANIPDTASQRYNNVLAGKIAGPSHKVAIYPHRPLTWKTPDKPTDYVGHDNIGVYFVEERFIFDEPNMRSFLAEASNTFVALQELPKRSKSSNFLNITRTYRSVMRACLEKLKETVDTLTTRNSNGNGNDESIEETDDSKLSKIKDNISHLYSIECIWHLCEIHFLDTTALNVIMPHLLEWIRFQHPHNESAAAELILSGHDACEKEEYWPVIKGLILQGQTEVARTLLKMNPLASMQAYSIADQILKTMPNYMNYNSYTMTRYRSQWEYWREDAERKILAKSMVHEPELEEIIKLVIGDDATWNEIIEESVVWYEYLPGFLFYTNPAFKIADLKRIATTWMSRWARLKDINDGIKLEYLDRIILYILECNLNEVFNALHDFPDSNWTATHLIDLFYNTSDLCHIENLDEKEFNNMRNSLVYEFGVKLMTRNNLWQFGLDYLNYCSNEGIISQEILIPRIRTYNERQVLKLLSVCKKKGFTDAEAEICKVQFRECYDMQRYGDALEWAMRSKDAYIVTKMADFILNNYQTTGNFLCSDILNNLGAKMFISHRLVFLKKYFDFFQFYKERQFLKATELLLNLLDSNMTPEFFWPTLLLDVCPLLETSDPKIYASETVEILRHIQLHLLPIIEKNKTLMRKNPEQKIEILKDYRMDNIEELLEILQLACSRNLTRTFIMEAVLTADDD